MLATIPISEFLARKLHENKKQKNQQGLFYKYINKMLDIYNIKWYNLGRDKYEINSEGGKYINNTNHSITYAITITN